MVTCEECNYDYDGKNTPEMYKEVLKDTGVCIRCGAKIKKSKKRSKKKIKK